MHISDKYELLQQPPILASLLQCFSKHIKCWFEIFSSWPLRIVAAGSRNRPNNRTKIILTYCCCLIFFLLPLCCSLMSKKVFNWQKTSLTVSGSEYVADASRRQFMRTLHSPWLGAKHCFFILSCTDCHFYCNKCNKIKK